MKIPDPSEVVREATTSEQMKASTSGGRKPGNGSRRNGASIPALPVEWMDPMSWRLPSGKALAEFALQAGFLAPLILSGPRRTKRPMERGSFSPAPERQKEAPERTGTFRT